MSYVYGVFQYYNYRKEAFVHLDKRRFATAEEADDCAFDMAVEHFGEVVEGVQGECWVDVPFPIYKEYTAGDGYGCDVFAAVEIEVPKVEKYVSKYRKSEPEPSLPTPEPSLPAPKPSLPTPKPSSSFDRDENLPLHALKKAIKTIEISLSNEKMTSSLPDKGHNLKARKEKLTRILSRKESQANFSAPISQVQVQPTAPKPQATGRQVFTEHLHCAHLDKKGKMCKKPAFQNRMCKTHYEKYDLQQKKLKDQVEQDYEPKKNLGPKNFYSSTSHTDDPLRRTTFRKTKNYNDHNDEQGMISLKK